MLHLWQHSSREPLGRELQPSMIHFCRKPKEVIYIKQGKEWHKRQSRVVGWWSANMLGHSAMLWYFRMSQWQLLNHTGESLLSPSSLFSKIPESGTGVASWRMWVGCNITSFWSHSPTTGLKTGAKIERLEQASAQHLIHTWFLQHTFPFVSSVTPSHVGSYFQPWAPLFCSLGFVLMVVPAT